MKTITPQQLKKLQTIRNQDAWLRDSDAWHGFIMRFTDGRTNTSKQLSLEEARELIELLDESNRKMRNKVYAICASMGWFQSGSRDDDKMNWAIVDKFLKVRGVVKKPIRQCSHKELVAVVSQFENIQKKGLDKELKAILTEAGIAMSSGTPLNTL